MKFKRAIIIFLFAPLLSQCTHASYKYSGEFFVNNSDVRGTFHSVRTEPHYTNAIGCVLSFWLYGGWCWSYLFEPTSRIANSAFDDTQERLTKQFGKTVQVSAATPLLLTWSRADREYLDARVTHGNLEKNSVASVDSSASEGKPAIAGDSAKQDFVEEISLSRKGPENVSGLKLLFPFVLGFGVGYEYVSPVKLSAELGGGVVVGNQRGLNLQLKYPLVHNKSNLFKFGAVAAQLDTPRKRDDGSEESYFFRERSYGIVLDLQSLDFPSVQLFYFLDKTEYEITPFVLSFIYNLDP